LRLAAEHGAITVPTLAGFLLFGRNESMEQVVPQSALQLVRYSGVDAASPVVERAEFAGNLTRLFDRALAFTKRYVDLWDTRPPRIRDNKTDESALVRARANYPREAIVEALTNMLVHRDYSIVGTRSRVSIFEDRIEIN
jgi:ATP-dependent DNA helicase RecG